MVDEDVALAQQGEDVDRRAGVGHRPPPGRARRERRHGEVGAVEPGDRPELAEVERRRQAVDVDLAELELPAQELDGVGGHLGPDLEPHGPAEAPLAQLELDRGEQVLVLAVVDVGVGVAGDPEGVARADPHLGEQSLEVRRDHLLEGHEALRRRRRRSAERRRDLHTGETALPVTGSSTETARSSDSSRCRGRDGRGRRRSGVRTGNMSRSKWSPQPALVGGAESRRIDDLDAGGGQTRPDGRR